MDDFNNAEESSYTLRDIRHLWEAEKYPVRHAFNKYDSDGSGNIDRSEFAALLRHIGVNFTAAQFENAVTQLDPNDDGIDFDEFIDWWANFEAMSAGKLIQMNFDPRILLLLREIKYFRLMQLPIPTAGKELANFESSFRRNISHCELIVSRYNSIHVSLLPVEWPLVQDRLEALEKQLVKGLGDLTWQPALDQIQKVERHERLLRDYLSATLTQVSNLSAQLDQLKGNVFKIEQQAKRWAEKPLVERRRGDTKPLDTIAARLKLAERKGKMTKEAEVLHQVVMEESQMLQIGGPPRVPRPPQRRQSVQRRSSSTISGPSGRRQSSIIARRNIMGPDVEEASPARARVLVESTSMTASVNQKRLAWTSYIEYLDGIQFRGIRNAVLNTMAHLLVEINVDHQERTERGDDESPGGGGGGGAGAGEVELRTMDPLFHILLQLTAASADGNRPAEASFAPDLDENTPIVFTNSSEDVAAASAEFGAQSLMSQLMTVVDDIKSVADAVRHLSDSSKSFRVKLEYDEEVIRMTSLFLSAVEGRVESCRQYRNNVFLPYAFLWTENRQRFLQDFLRETNKSSSKDPLVTAEQALSTIVKPTQSGGGEGGEIGGESDGDDDMEDASSQPLAQVMMSAPNIPEFEEMISKYTHIERLVSEMPSSQKFDFILLDCEPMKNSLRNATGRWTMTFTHYLEQYIDVSVTDFYRFIELVSVGIKGGEIGWKADNYDQNRLTILMKYLFTIQQYTRHYENLVEPLQSIVALLRKIGVAVHKVIVKKIDRMRTKWTEMLHQVYTVRDALSSVQSLETEKIYRKEEALVVAIDGFTKSLETDLPTYVMEDDSEAYSILNRLYLDLQVLEESQQQMKSAQELFGMDVLDSSTLSRHRSTLVAFKHMWDIAALIKDEAEVRGAYTWGELGETKLDGIYEELKRSMTMLEELPGDIARTTVYFTLHEQCAKLQQTLPLIADLHDDAMRPRHWQQLALQLKSRIDIRSVQDGTLTFLEIVGLELSQRPRVVAEAIGRARKELSVERALNDMNRIWARQEFTFELDHSIGFDLLVVDESLLQTLEDKQITLQNIMAGAHFDHFSTEVETWQSVLHSVECVVVEWIATQKSWRSLRAIFLGSSSSSEDLQERIPEQYQEYRDADKQFRSLLREVQSSPNVMATCKLETTSAPGEGPLAQLAKMHSVFATCQQALLSFLAAKQADFPRFCFISNDTLLTILSVGDDAVQVQSHIAKLFDGLESLKLQEGRGAATVRRTSRSQVVARVPSVRTENEEDELRATSSAGKELMAIGMRGAGDETILFDQSRHVRCEGPVEEWLSTVEENMQTELKFQIQSALVSAAGFQYKPRPAWVLEYPSQVVAVASQIQWSSDLSKAIRATGYENEHVLLDFHLDQQRMLRDLIMLVQSDLKPSDRLKVMTMVTLDVHGRDVAKHFVDDASLLARGPDSFAWRSQLRTNWNMTKLPVEGAAAAAEENLENLERVERPEKQEVQGAMVSCYDAEFEYAYEYLGNCGRLVITPLTDRCYLTLTQAMRLCLGGAPSGPAGTGKTETTKDLAHALGRAVWVFNCSDQMNHTVLGRIFKGLSLTGSWGCFDEFNRISTAVLSIVSTQFRTLTDAMRVQAMTDSRSGIEFVLDGESTRMHRHKCGVFITMNPGYAGRAELPESLKTLFRSVTMMRPDLALITENLLLSQGFVHAGVLAGQIVTMTSMAQRLLSLQIHYDWTLRTVKTIIHIAGNIRREKPKKSESSIVYSSITTLMMPKLVATTGDQKIFRSILKCLYPEFAAKLRDSDPDSDTSSSSSDSESDEDGTNSNMLSSADSSLRDSITQSAQSSGLEPSDSFVQRVVDARALLKVRHSLFILGAEATGKTELWRTLAKLNTRTGLETTYQRVSPKTMDLDELFGRTSEKTKEWQDGVFTGIMRAQSSTTTNQQGKGQKWVVLDGDVDPEWVESLNTVMDDNKVLTLSNNERIVLRDNMRILIEAVDLSFATPATVSRAGVLFVNDADGSWESYVSVWARKKFAKHGKRLNTIRHLMTSYLSATTAQMSDTGCLARRYQIVPVCSFGLVRSTLSLFENLLQSNEALFTSRKLRESSNNDDGSSHKLELMFNFAIIWSFGGMLKHEHRWRFSSWLRNFWTQEHGSQRVTLVQVAYGTNNSTTTVKKMYPETETVFDWLPVLVGGEEHASLSSSAMPTSKDTDAGGGNGGSSGGGRNGGNGGNGGGSGGGQVQVEFHPWSSLIPKNMALPINLPLKMQHDGTIEGVLRASKLPPPSLLQLLIPCPSSVCISYLLQKRSDRKENVLLVGPTGCGKTVTMRHYLEWLSSSQTTTDASSRATATVSRSASLTYASTTQTLQNLIDESLEKKAGKTYSPPGRQSIVLFIDDLNLPRVDQYGTQRALTLIQHHLDTGIMYDRIHLTEKQVTGIRYSACLDPSAGSGVGYRPDTARLLRHFSVHSMSRPSNEQIVDIFTHVMSSHLLECYFYGAAAAEAAASNSSSSGGVGPLGALSAAGANSRSSGSYAMFESGAHGVGLRLVQATMALHNSVAKRFTASAKHFYYGFSMKHVASCIQGLLQVTPSVASSPRAMARLWLHETARIYGDGLSNDTHRSDFARLQRDVLRTELCTPDMGSGRTESRGDSGSSSLEGDQVLAAWSASDTADALSAFQRPEVVFGRGARGGYTEYEDGTDGAAEDLRMIQQSMPPPTRGISAAPIVLFREAVADIVRISRVLQITGGHGLLVGVGGSGKRSLTRMASKYARVLLREIKNDSPHDTSEFSETLKSLCKDAGVKGISSAVLITEPLLASSYVMHVINSMVSGVGMGGLFAKSERDEISQSVKLAVRRSGEMDTAENCWAHFNSEVTRNIHIMCTVSPASRIFRQQFTRYPALLRNTTRIHVLPWKTDALQSVAVSLLSSLEDEDLELTIHNWENAVVNEVLEEYRQGLLANNEDITLETNMRRLLKQFRMTEDTSTLRDVDTHGKIAKFLVSIHESAGRLAETLREERSCFVHVTPALFLRSVLGFRRLVISTKRNIRQKFDRLALGRFKLITTTERVEKMQQFLVVASADVSSAMETAERQREKLGEESHKVDEEAKVAAVEEEECERIRIDMQALKYEAEADLEIALPLMERAQRALDSLDKGSLTELKSFKAPHREVHMVMMAVLTLLSGVVGSGVKLRPSEIKKGPEFLINGGDSNVGPLGWYAAQRCMRDVGGFLSLLRSYAATIDAGQVNAESILAVDAYLRMDNFDRSTIERRSSAAAGICEWVINIRKYYEVWCEVDPKRKHLEAEAKRLAKSEAKLISAKNHFRKVQEQLSLLTDAFTSATAKKNDALRRYQMMSQKLELAERLRSVLASEKSRWEAEITTLSNQSGSFIGDTLRRIAFATYSGGFDGVSRYTFLQEQCIEEASSLGLEISDESREHMASVAVTDRERADWSSLGDLPEDHNSQDNAALLSLASHTPIIVDPHQQASQFLAKLHQRLSATGATTPLRIASMIGASDAEQGWRTVLRSGVSRGEAVLLENVGAELAPEIVRVLESCPPCNKRGRLPRPRVVTTSNTIEQQQKNLKQLHQQEQSVGGAAVSGSGTLAESTKQMSSTPTATVTSSTKQQGAIVSFGGLEVRVHPKFRLFLTSREARPQFSPDLQILTTMVDFTVSEFALAEQLLGVTVALEHPELEQRKQKIRLSLGKLRGHLKELEDDLLLALSSSQGDVLSNENLVQSLEHTKKTALDVAVQVEEAHLAERETDDARGVYVPVAERGVLIFSIWESLRQVDPLYQLSLESFMRVFILSIQHAGEAAKRGELGTRIGRTITSGFDPDEPEMRDNKHKIEASEVSILLESVTLSCFRSAARVLFERHKAGYLFVLAIRLLMVYVPQVLPNDVVDLLLGEWLRDMVSVATDQHSPLEWLPTPEWLAILQLSNIDDFVLDFSDDGRIGGGSTKRGGGAPSGLAVCSFKALPQHIMSHPARWERWFRCSHPETEYLPGEWRSCSIVHHLCLVRVLRPDRLRPMIYRLIDEPTLSLGIGPTYVQVLSAPFVVADLLRDARLPDLGTSGGDGGREGVGSRRMASSSLSGVRMAPMIFIVCPGTDPTEQLRREAKEIGTNLSMTALGQGQFEKARAMIRSAWSKGGWILLQNIHLVPDDLKRLTGLIEELNNAPIPRSRPPRATFCLFMTAEPALATLSPPPLELIRGSLTTTLEPPGTFDAHLRRALGKFGASDWLKCDPQPMAYQRTLFSLCYWHAVSLSRRDFGPVGWSTHYPFGDADLRMSAEIMHRVFMGGGATIDIVGLQHLVGHIVYGGHIVDPFDRRLCMAYMRRLFHESMMVNEDGCYFAQPDEEHVFPGLLVPQVDVVDDYSRQVEEVEIPYERFGPLLMGMHPNTQLASATAKSINIVTTMSRLLSVVASGHGPVDLEHAGKVIDSLLDDLPHVGMQTNNDATSVIFRNGNGGGGGGGRGAGGAGGGASGSLDDDDDDSGGVLSSSSGSYTFLYSRERRTLVEGLTQARDELQLAESYCRGETMASPETLDVVESVAAGKTPRRWVSWTSPNLAMVGVTQWIAKVRRTHEFQALWGEAVMRQSNGTPPLMDLSCILNPRALLAAVILDGARLIGKSLDNVVLSATLTKRQAQGITRGPQGGGLFLSGLRLEGATWDSTGTPPMLRTANERQGASTLPVVHVFVRSLEEIRLEEKEAKAAEASKREESGGGFGGGQDAGGSERRTEYHCPVYANKCRGASHLFDLPFPCDANDQRLERWTVEGVAVVLAEE